MSAIIFLIFIAGTLLLCYKESTVRFFTLQDNVPYEMLGCDRKQERCTVRDPIGEVKFYYPSDEERVQMKAGITVVRHPDKSFEETVTLSEK